MDPFKLFYIHTYTHTQWRILKLPWSNENDMWKIHYTHLLAFSQLSSFFDFFSPRNLNHSFSLYINWTPISRLATKIYQNKNLIIIKASFYIGSYKSICIYNSYANALSNFLTETCDPVKIDFDNKFLKKHLTKLCQTTYGSQSVTQKY